jgi:hypothetical protein
LDARTTQPAEPSVGELFGRLKEDAKAYAAAEANLYKAIARRRIGRARGGAVALVVAALLANAALIVLLMSLSLALALHVGPVIAGLIVTVVVCAIAFFLVRWGAAKLQALSGDAEERAALAAGERLL